MSFSDMMSSGRGPGVIGMVMALVVLLGFGVLFMFAFDEGFQGAELSDEAAIVQQGKEIENYQVTLDKGQKSLDLAPQRVSDAKELTRLGLENQMLSQNITTLIEKQKAGEAEIVEKNKAFDAYKDDYRAYVRGKAKGETMDQLSTTSGVVYKNVSIREVTAIGIQIRHDEGQKRIAFEDLPDEMKDYYQFDPNQKEDAKKAEDAAREAHEKEVGISDKLAEADMAKQRERDAVLDKEKRRRNIAEKEAQILALQSDIRRLNTEMNNDAAKSQAARSAGRMHIKKSNSLGAAIKSKQNAIADLRAEVQQMRASL
jgi:hypothetical protein